VLKQGAGELQYFESPTSTTPKGSIQLRAAEVFVPRQVMRIKADYKINFCIASQERAGAEPTCTLLAATTDEERDMWVGVITAAAKPQGPKATKSVGDVTNAASKTTAAEPPAGGRARGASKVGVDTGASRLDAGAEASLEQLKWLDADVLSGPAVRIGKLKQVLQQMGVDYSGAFEKTDLVALVVEHRKA